jgi:hypothetical protein
VFTRPCSLNAYTCPCSLNALLLSVFKQKPTLPLNETVQYVASLYYALTKLTASSGLWRLLLLFVLAVLGNERNLSPQSKEAGSWLLYYKCPCNSQQDIMNAMLSRLYFTHNLRRKLKELYSYIPSGWQMDQRDRGVQDFWYWWDSDVMVCRSEWNTYQHSSLHW